MDNDKKYRPRLIGGVSGIFLRDVIFVALIALALAAAALFFSITSAARLNGDKYARFAAFETVGKFEIYLSEKIAIARKVTESKEILDWLKDEFDDDKKSDAFDRLSGYSDLTGAYFLHLTSAATLNSYSFYGGTADEFLPREQALSRELESDKWYFSVMERPEEYFINVDSSDAYGGKRLWIDYKIYGEAGVIGTFSLGIYFDEVLGDIFSGATESGARVFVIDREGYIRLDNDKSGVITETHSTHDSAPNIRAIASDKNCERAIADYLGGNTAGYYEKRGDPVVTSVKGGGLSYMTIAPILRTDWSVVTFYDSGSAFTFESALPMAAGLIGVLALSLTVGSLFVRRRVISPLMKLSRSVLENERETWGNGRRDEFGELAKSFMDARADLQQNNELLQESLKETTRKSELLRIVNAMAEDLMSEDGGIGVVTKRCMGHMAETIDSDRALVWKMTGERGENGSHKRERLAEWTNGKVASLPIEVYGDMSEYMFNKISSESIFFIFDADIPENEREHYRETGIISVFSVPVYLSGAFWGFIVFENCHGARTVADSEIGILRSGSVMIANAIMRGNMLKEIIQARDEAQSANKAKAAFLSNMSHSLLTPMNTIIGSSAIARATSDLGEKHDCLRQIEETALSLTEVMHDILDISEIEANRFKLDEADFEIEKSARDVIEGLRRSSGEKLQELAVTIDDDLPKVVVGDEGRFKQVISKLLSNAIKFTPKRGFLAFSMSLLSEGADYIVAKIEVKDSGVGLDEESADRLFKPFTPENTGFSLKYGGAGLSMKVCANVVSMMGGDIRAVSEGQNKGTVMSFTVRLKLGEQPRKTTLLVGFDKPAESDETNETNETNGLFFVKDVSEAAAYMAGDNYIGAVALDWGKIERDAPRFARMVKGRFPGRKMPELIAVTDSPPRFSDEEYKFMTKEDFFSTLTPKTGASAVYGR